jgi:integrase
VQAIDVALVMRVLEPLWLTRTETASRLRGRIESILDWATARGFRSGENPARLRGHLDQLLPKKSRIRTVRHQPAMPFRDVPGFMARLREQTSVHARALEFTILCATRTSETIGATWSEIDPAVTTWSVAAERIKAGRLHRVPLSDRAHAILNELPRERGNPHIFIGARAGKGLHDRAMLQQLHEMVDGFTVHGFRSSFRDWAAECTNFPRELAEAALAHKLQDQTERAYQRGDLLERRRKLMQAWARFCSSPPQASGEVVPLAAKR